MKRKRTVCVESSLVLSNVCLGRLLLLVLLGSFPTFADVATFDGFGYLDGFMAYDVSADGSVVVGGRINWDAVRWTKTGGIAGLGDLDDGRSRSRSWASGVSADGSVVVGSASSASGIEAFRWTQSDDEMVGLGHLPGYPHNSFAYSVSADGSVVVGYGYNSTNFRNEAFRWNQIGGMASLGDLDGGWYSSRAYDVSADGSVVVGEGSSASGYEAFRWTENHGMVGLGYLPELGFQSAATAASADGSVVVGSSGKFAREAFRWTESSGMVALGDLAGGTRYSVASEVSADGSVVVGTSYSYSGAEAFIWDEANGMQSLQDLLTDTYGLDLAGWSLQSATSISANGSTIVGYGMNPDGYREAWRAVINDNPPGTTPDSPLMPVVIDIGWQFNFNIVNIGNPVFIDPIVAIGYDYIVDSGPDIASVILPSVGDNLYNLWLWDDTTSTYYDTATDISGGSWYDFAGGGVDRFRILGIETGLGLDPSDPTAFVTGLTFAGVGSVIMSQTPITFDTDTVVPIPTSVLLCGIGLSVAGLRLKRKRGEN